jgi:membrane-bound lytic murein transglycosylase D
MKVIFISLLFIMFTATSCSIEPINKTRPSYAISHDDEVYTKKAVAKLIDESITLKDVQNLKSSTLQVAPSNRKIKSEHFLNYQNISATKFWIKFYTKRDRARFKRHLINAMAVENIVKPILQTYGLPADLFYVGLIESGYNLRIKSRAKATGPWQFMKGTAKKYGLKVNRWKDERTDLKKSTHAAARYFTDLYNIFGSWELALVAYNTGEYKVIRSIRKANSRNLATLIRKRLLYKETIHYIPKVLAAKKIFQSPKSYGFKPWELRNLSFRIKTKYQLGKFIPAHKKLLHVNKINKNLKKLVKNKNIHKYYKYRVKKGDNLTLISKITQIPIYKIKSLNNLRSSNIYPNQRISLPLRMQLYRVKKGDSLYRLSKRFNIPTSKIKFINSLKKNKIFPKQKIYIPVLL